MGENENEGVGVFSVAPNDRTGGNGHKHMKFHLNTKEHFFTMRVSKHRDRSHREVVWSPSVEILKI